MFKVDKSLNYGRAQLLEFAKDIDSVESVLDVGAGRGTDLLGVKALFPQAQLYGLEGYAPNVELLTSKGITVFPVDIERQRIPLPDGSLDLVLSNQVFEHLKELFWVTHEISRVLRPGGSLILGVPNLASFHNRVLLAVGRQPTCINNSSAHVRGFTKHDLLRFMSNTFPGGYELTGFAGSNFYPFSPAFAVPLARWFPDFAASCFYHFKKRRTYDRQVLEFLERERLETPFLKDSSLQ